VRSTGIWRGANGMFFMCELNEDMISVKDMNGDGEITSGTSFDDADIMYQKGGIENYTEAPWLYRRSDEQGSYYGGLLSVLRVRMERVLGICDGAGFNQR